MNETRQSSPDTTPVDLPPAGAMQLARARLQATGTIFIVLIVLLAWIALKNPNFTDPAVFLNFVRRATPLMVLAAGQVFVIAIGGLDLSVGSTVTATVVVSAMWFDGQSLLGISMPATSWAIIPGVIVMAALIGLINGLIVTKLRVPSFIATLGMLLILSGAVDYWTGGAPRGYLSDGFRRWGIKGFEDVPIIERLPYAVIIMLAVAIVSSLLLHRTTFGHQILAIGESDRTSFVSGVAVHRVRILAFVISAISAAIAGILLGGIGGISADVGGGLEFEAIAAVVLGGTSLAGGRASAPGAVVGALTLSAIFTLLNLYALDEGIRNIVQGLIVIAAVGGMARRELRGG